jgi:transcriptional regulator with XRE-family HTH domain
MATHYLTNYLRTYRKRLGLSEDEIAFLLECKSGAKVSRHEHFGRDPSLRTALAYEAIFQVPVRELFAGIYQTVEQNTLKQIRTLSEKLQASDPPHPRHQRRRAQVEAALLTRLINIDHKHE